MANIHPSVHGTANYEENSNIFSFNPLLPQFGNLASFRRQGLGQQLPNGSFYFVPVPGHKSHARLIAKLSHGRLSRTVNNEFLLTIRIPRWEARPASIIASDSVAAMNALNDYIYGEEEAA